MVLSLVSVQHTSMLSMEIIIVVFILNSEWLSVFFKDRFLFAKSWEMFWHLSLKIGFIFIFFELLVEFIQVHQIIEFLNFTKILEAALADNFTTFHHNDMIRLVQKIYSMSD